MGATVAFAAVVGTSAAAQAPDGPDPWEARGYSFLPDGHRTCAIAVRRTGLPPAEGACDPVEFLVANGCDQQPQYLFGLAVTGFPPLCRPAAWATSIHSDDALYFGDVVTADLDRDGVDEVFAAALADASGAFGSGEVFLEHGGGEWAERTLAAGLSAASLAVGDVDGDGDLDLVVGTWQAPDDLGRALDVPCPGAREPGPPLAPQPVAVRDANTASAIGPTLIWLGERARRGRAPFGAEPLRVDGARGVGAIRLADVDLDGRLDLVLAGHDVRVLYGEPSAPGAGPRFDCRVLPWNPAGGDPTGAYAHDVDVAFARSANGTPRTLIAASEGCVDRAACEARATTLGVSTWSITPGIRDPSDLDSQRGAGFVPTQGLASAVRFAHVDADVLPDLLVGRQTDTADPECASADAVRLRPGLGPIGCVGARLLVVTGVEPGRIDGPGAPIRLRSFATLPLDPTLETFPMAWRLVPYADPSRTRVEPLTAPVDGVVSTWPGRGRVAGVDSVEADGHPVPFWYVPGDSHVSLATPRSGEVTVAWRVSDDPGYLVANRSPLPGATGGGFALQLLPVPDVPSERPQPASPPPQEEP